MILGKFLLLTFYPAPVSFDSAQLIQFLQQHFLLPFALGIDAEYFFRRMNVKKTSAKTDQKM